MMKRSFFVIAALGLVFGYSACERQKWEETRVLHKKHDEHKQDDSAAASSEKK